MDITKSSAPAHPTTEEKRLATPEERYRHEIVDVEQRCELPERTLRLRRKIGVS